MTNEEKAKHQRPEGALLERAMKTPPKTSGRQLAEMVGLSEGRIRQIVNGYKSEAGMILPIVGPADTVARLAAALEIAPDEFDKAGRQDVADILRGDITSGVTEEGELWLADLELHRETLVDWLEAGVESDPPEGPLMLWGMDSLVRAIARKHRDEMDFLNNLLSIARNENSKGGDGDADNTGGSAPTRLRPVEDLEQIDEAAHDEEHTIEEEQEGDELP